MSGLRHALITRGSQKGKPAKKPHHYSLGGDVDGGKEDGVGESAGHGASASDWSGGFGDSWAGTEASFGDGYDSYAEAHAGDSGERGGSSNGSFSSFGGATPDGRMSGSVSYADSMPSGIDWGREMQGATLGGLMDGVTFEGADPGFSDINTAGALGALGLGGGALGFDGFGAQTATGALPGNLEYQQGSGLGKQATSAVDFGVEDLAKPEEETDLGALATAVSPGFMNLTPDEMWSMDIRGPSLVHPDRRAGYATAITEQLSNIDKGKTYGAPEVGVLATRAASNYGADRKSWNGIATDTLYGQAVAPAQFSGITTKSGAFRDKELDRAYAWAEANPEKAAKVAATVEGILQGDVVPPTIGATAFSTPGTARKSGNDGTVGTINGHAFGNYSQKAADAYAERVNPEEEPEEVYGPSMFEGDPLAAGRVAGFEGGHLPGVSYGNQDRINAAVMSELAGKAAPAPAATAQAAPPALESAPSRTTLSDLAFGLGTAGTVTPEMQFSVEDLGARPPEQGWGIGSGLRSALGISEVQAKDQSRSATRTDLPELTTDRNAPGRATLGGSMAINAQPSTGAPKQDPSAPSNSIAQTIADFFGFGTPAATPAPATAAKAPNFEETFEADKTARGPQATPVQVATPPAAPPAPELPPEEEAAKPSVAQPGTRTAGSAVAPQTAAVAAAATRSAAAPAQERAAPARGAATSEVFGPTMPGMAPGMTSYPERGVINQPSTWAHEKIAERVGAGAARGIGSAMTGGLFGLADMGSGWLGGPSTSGLFANSTPGLDLSLGFQEPGEHPSEYPGSAPSKPAETPKADKPKASTTSKVQSAPLWGENTYKGPPRNPLTYGYGGERVMWKGPNFARGGYVDCPPAKKAVNRGGALPVERSIKAKAKRTA